VVRPPVTGGSLRPRLVPGKKGALLIVVNDSIEEQTSRIVVPQHYSHATNIHTEQVIPMAESAIDLTVGDQSVAVILLE
jgi:hypothetical protein